LQGWLETPFVRLSGGKTTKKKLFWATSDLHLNFLHCYINSGLLRVTDTIDNHWNAWLLERNSHQCAIIGGYRNFSLMIRKPVLTYLIFFLMLVCRHFMKTGIKANTPSAASGSKRFGFASTMRSGVWPAANTSSKLRPTQT